MSDVASAATYALIDELDRRDQLLYAVTEYRRRNPWWHRFRLGPQVWGLSTRWLAVCPWNGEAFWMQLPFVYFEAGIMHAELGLGRGKWMLHLDARWRWE